MVFDGNMVWHTLTGMALFVIGFVTLQTQAHILRRIMALNIMGMGVFLVFIAIAAQSPGAVPDPVPQAMVLTGIVVAVCATGLALVLAARVQEATGKTVVSDAGAESGGENDMPETRPGDRDQPRSQREAGDR